MKPPATPPPAAPADALGDDVLKRLAGREVEGRTDDLESLAGALEAPRARLAGTLEALVRAHWLARPAAHFELTETGRRRGRLLLRSHRLLETQLARDTGLAPEKWHEAADRAEHALTPAETNTLADALGNPRFDPHGDPIPDRNGRIVAGAPATLLAWTPGQPGVIVHLEDEPPALYARLYAIGLAPGVMVRLVRRTPAVLEIEVEGRTHTLTSTEAELIQLTAPTAGRVATVASRRRLADLAPGVEAVVAALSPVIRGRARQRLLDLGFVPGTRIVREFEAALRSPVAFRVRGTLVALRSDQTEHILIEAETATPTS